MSRRRRSPHCYTKERSVSSHPHFVRANFTPGISWFPNGGGTEIHPILDLRALNRYLTRYKFRMLPHASLLRLVRRNDWFTSVDVKDAYFHIPIYSPDRKYLQFTFWVPCVPLWPLFDPESVCVVYRGGDCPAAAPGHPPGHIPTTSCCLHSRSRKPRRTHALYCGICEIWVS